MARICMLVTSELDHDPRVQKEASLAVQYEHEVTVVCRSYVGAPMPYRVLECGVGRQSKQLTKYIERLRTNFALVRYARSCRPQIIHANDLDTLPAGFVASRLTGARLVYDAHELWTDVGSVGAFGKSVALWLEKAVSRRASAVVAVSRHRAEIMSETLGIPQPLVVMNTPFYTPPEALQEGAWLAPFQGKRIVLYQGGYADYMGLPDVALAAQYLPEDVVLVFRGYGRAEKNLRDTIEQNGLSARVFLIPAVPMNAMVQSAVGADLGIITYKPVNKNSQYAAPNKMFEYMMAGVPSVGSDLPYIREILCGLGVGELFVPGDSQDLARVINGLLNEPAKLAAMKQRCLASAAQFCWEKEGAKLMQTYERVLA
jgi:glycosyltransferase involved in cell wall biosynthesis